MVAFVSEAFDTGVFDAGDVEGTGFDATAFGAPVLFYSQSCAIQGAECSSFGVAKTVLFVESSAGDTATYGTSALGAAVTGQGFTPFVSGTALMHRATNVSGFDATSFGQASLPGVIKPSGSSYTAIGTAYTAAKIAPPGLTTQFGTLTTQLFVAATSLTGQQMGSHGVGWPTYSTLGDQSSFTGPVVAPCFAPSSITPGDLGTAQVGPMDGTPDYLYAASFSGFSSTSTHRVGGKVTGSGLNATLFGDLSHRVWSFGGSDASEFGTQLVIEREGSTYTLVDTRFPTHESLIYSFSDSEDNIYGHGFKSAAPPSPKVSHLLRENLSTQPDVFGTALLAPNEPVDLSIDSTRLPSTHYELRYAFGLNPTINADSWLDGGVGLPTLLPAIGVTGFDSAEMGSPSVSRNISNILLFKNAKTNVQFDGVFFQFGLPKKDILGVGIKPGGVGVGLRIPRIVQPEGFEATQIWHWYWPRVKYYDSYIHMQYTGYDGTLTTVFPNPTVSGGVAGIRPSGVAPGPVPSSASIYKVTLSAHPPTIVNAQPSSGALVRNVQQTIRPLGWLPYLDSLPRVWYKEPQYLGPVHSVAQPETAYVQCVLLDPDFYTMQGFRTTRCGIPSVRRASNLYPSSITTVWGLNDVGHKNRSVFDWNPWKQTRFGETAVRNLFIPPPSLQLIEAVWGSTPQSTETRIGFKLSPTSVFGELVGGVTALVDSTDCGCHVCNQLPRYLVPKELPATQFGDFDTNV